MIQKLNDFKHEEIAKKVHLYLTELSNVIVDDSAKGPSIGYYIEKQKYKFATLIAGSYQSLVLHVYPGNGNTSLGKTIQLKVQNTLGFEIKSIRSHVIKPHEVYIPLEKLDSLNPTDDICKFIDFAYHKQGRNKNTIN